MTRRNYSDQYDPELTREDMGRPTRAEARRDMAEDRYAPAPDCGGCRKCLNCAVRGSR